jgi:hypothetical protein
MELRGEIFRLESKDAAEGGPFGMDRKYNDVFCSA